MHPRALNAIVVAAAVSGVLSWGPRAEAAPGKAWAAARASLPARTEILFGLDLTQLARTSTFKLLLPLVYAQQPALKDGLAMIKATCGFDPLTAVEAVVVGASKDQQEGALYVALKGLDEAAIATCMEAVANAQAAAATRIEITRERGITQLAVGADRVFLRWIGKDVIALPLDFTDRAQLEAWTTGKRALARGAVGPYVKKLDTRAAVWGVSTRPEDIDGAQAKSGYGSLATGGGTLAPELHIILGSAAEATTVAHKATTDIAARAAAKDVAPGVKAVLETVTVTAAGAEIVIKAQIAEKQVLSLVGALLRGA